ncbi:MAG: 50S ribosomal protein L21 [Mycoplasmataceae bacterium]|nr:50S ribosomal protein L21 [Mycoplasmataceae bacterium]
MTSSYAIIKSGGKQLKVIPGQAIWVEKLSVEEDQKYTFDEIVALSDDGKLIIGTPLVENASVIGIVQKNGRGPKLIIFRTKAKSNWSRKQGHRQPYTRILIQEILLNKKTIASVANQEKIALIKAENVKTETTKKVATDLVEKKIEVTPRTSATKVKKETLVKEVKPTTPITKEK